jgi:hypothetical protein
MSCSAAYELAEHSCEVFPQCSHSFSIRCPEGTWRLFTALAEHAHPVRSKLCESVTNGARTRALWSHNPPMPVARRCRRLRKPLI